MSIRSAHEEQDIDLEFTPTWVVAAVCSVIVGVSFAVERLLHYAGKRLKKKNQITLYEALLKIKEELMVLGFISLFLSVSQFGITKICVPKSWTHHMLPCSLEEKEELEAETNTNNTTSHLQNSLFFSGNLRHLLALAEAEVAAEAQRKYCARKNKVPLLSNEAVHHLHIFIFVLAIAHVTFCVLTVVIGGLRIRQWKQWEESVATQNNETHRDLEPTVTLVHQHAFIRDHFLGIGKDSALLGWVKSFFKQFYGSVTRLDYVTLRLGFIMTHCRGNPKFNFHKYMIRAVEDDFKKVVGISWYLWIFVVIFLLININGWHTYFWIAFIPVIILLAVGTKLEHVIIELANEVAERHVAIEGELVVQPSDHHFWFNRPRIVLFFIHFILFQNAFEISYFFWILVTYGFHSCIMGPIGYIIPRLIIGLFIQLLCTYSTLPLYAIVTQMGTHFKKHIFEEQLGRLIIYYDGEEKAKKEDGSKGDEIRGEHENSHNNGSGGGVHQPGLLTRRASSLEANNNVSKEDKSN
ncbi:MLO-like protein 1 [Stylosanthes scabra]|uniref:MLO-like protein n=1 Tax=Stylosanthes scabra TaxID=79078 RepID=A0ABU6Q7E7_9FABA|nr:MLO-like protein 1 [Stylosanthes scabra]